MGAASSPSDVGTPWQVVAGIVAASVGTVAAFGLVGAMTSLRILLAMGEPEQDALLGPSLLLLASAALAVAALVAAIRARGWSRPALLVVAVATAAAALLVDQAWIGSVPIAGGAVLLWLPPAQAWFAERALARSQAAAPPRE